ncbi:hypothetical protein PV05_02134 [Exophiala xenobiotica]|uniref:Uncharacterized protein n=1 Tax=Exophiala xenobiotica TaxID=348802 RepID=A0A0D2F2C2_9EURO|nr:uncharacterized protein PV05_02134 [Exophiala xenobiotica]KIW62083.1 hypothetical protein PV05_02134 [Exophiala xenobiotica]
MSSQSPFYETADWPLQPSPRQSSLSSLSPASETASIQFSNFPLPPTPSTSRPPSDKSRLSSVPTDHTIHVPLARPLTISFCKGSKLFKLRYSQIELEKDVAGALKRILLSEPSGMTSVLVHSFPGTRIPIPHLEQPVTSGSSHISRVSFLEEQTVQTASTLFQAQPHYIFDTWEDCINFQEALLGQTVVFTAGIAEAKSKGRGEECISQNLRILRARNGRQVILFFTNSQRKEKKRYITIPRKYLYTCPTTRAILQLLPLPLRLGLSTPVREQAN